MDLTDHIFAYMTCDSACGHELHCRVPQRELIWLAESCLYSQHLSLSPNYNWWKHAGNLHRGMHCICLLKPGISMPDSLVQSVIAIADADTIGVGQHRDMER